MVAGCGGDGDRTAPTTVASPPGGRVREMPVMVTLTADEPATIYYTLNGAAPGPDGPRGEAPLVVSVGSAPLQFYAVDRAGNQEAVRSESYVVDIDGPGRVRTLATTVTGSTVTLTWELPNNPDTAGVVIARYGGPTEPTPTQRYVPGDLIGGAQVLYVGADTSLVVDNEPAGHSRFVAWAFDDLGNYGERYLAGALQPHPDQTCTFSASSGQASIFDVSRPSHLVITGAVQHDATASELTISLSVENRVNRILFNPKAAVDSVLVTLAGGGEVAAALADPDGQVDGIDVRYFGPDGLAPGAVATRELTIAGVGVGDAVTVTFRLIDSPMVASTYWEASAGSPGWLLDSQTGQLSALPAGGAPGGPAGKIARTGAQFSDDGRWLFTGARNDASIVRYDTTLLGAAQSVDVAGGTAIPSLVWHGPTQRLYGVLYESGHGSRWGRRSVSGFALVGFNEELEEEVRITLSPPSITSGSHMPGRLCISPDGALVAVPIMHSYPSGPAQHSIHLIDPDAQMARDIFQGLVSHSPTNCRFSSDGTTLYVGGFGSNGLMQLDLSATGRVERAHFAPGESVKSLAFASGRVWLGTRAGLASHDASLKQVVLAGWYTSPISAIVPAGTSGQLIVAHRDNALVERVDVTTQMVLFSTPTPDKTRRHSLAITAF
jgi:hypothetical protein